jgi:hypothetical protein
MVHAPLVDQQKCQKYGHRFIVSWAAFASKLIQKHRIHWVFKVLFGFY